VGGNTSAYIAENGRFWTSPRYSRWETTPVRNDLASRSLWDGAQFVNLFGQTDDVTNVLAINSAHEFGFSPLFQSTLTANPNRPVLPHPFWASSNGIEDIYGQLPTVNQNQIRFSKYTNNDGDPVPSDWAIANDSGVFVTQAQLLIDSTQSDSTGSICNHRHESRV